MPGSGVEHDYAGVVEGSFCMHLGPNVSFTLTGMRIIDHPFALFLLGADVLCGGRKAPSWNYEGIAVTTDDEGRVSGSVQFRSGKSWWNLYPWRRLRRTRPTTPRLVWWPVLFAPAAEGHGPLKLIGLSLDESWE